MLGGTRSGNLWGTSTSYNYTVSDHYKRYAEGKYTFGRVKCRFDGENRRKMGRGGSIYMDPCQAASQAAGSREEVLNSVGGTAYTYTEASTTREASRSPTSRSSFSLTIRLADVALVKPISRSIARLSPSPLHTTPSRTPRQVYLQVPRSALTFS